MITQEPEAVCDTNSICSFLQANNHVRPVLNTLRVKMLKSCVKGVNVVEYCKCKGFSECSTQWDPYDGKSITQAQSDQYKVGRLLFNSNHTLVVFLDSSIWNGK